MAIRTVVTRGYGNGTFNGTVALAVTRGYAIGSAAVPDAPGVAWLAPSQRPDWRLPAQTPDWLWMEAEPVVEAAIKAVERGQPVCVPGAVNKGLATVSRLLPEPIGRGVMAQQSRRFRDDGT